MKTKRWIGYTIYLLLMIGYLIGSHLLLTYLNIQAQREFYLLPYIYGSTAVYVLFGMILGFGHLYRQVKKEGKWRVNAAKLILIGVPAALLVLCRLVAYSAGSSGFIPSFIFVFIASNDYIPIALGVILGYTLVSSFDKSMPKASSGTAGAAVTH